MDRGKSRSKVNRNMVESNKKRLPSFSVVKNMPAMQETWVQFLGWEDSLEKGKTTDPSILAWRIPRTMGVTMSQT